MYLLDQTIPIRTDFDRIYFGEENRSIMEMTIVRKDNTKTNKLSN